MRGGVGGAGGGGGVLYGGRISCRQIIIKPNI